MRLRPLRRSTLLLCLLTLGCGGGSSEGGSEFRDDFDLVLDLRPAAGESTLPTLEPALSAAETRALVEAFSWQSASELLETDGSGRPALYYALIYLQSRDDLELLDLTAVHHSFVPLFAEEREKWKGQVGFFTLDGDGQGVFTFAVIPGIFFNIMRELALQGESVFRAVVLREPPPAAALSDGALSYEYLASQGFLYGGGLADEAEAADAQGTQSSAVRGQHAAFTSQVIRATVSPIEDTVDEIRAFFGELTGAFTGTARIVVSVRPANTDPSFDLATWMRRAWGDDVRDNDVPSLGAPMWIRDAIIQSHKGAALFRGRLTGWGEAGLTVAKGEQNLCVELANNAAEITNFLTALVLCNFRDPARPDLNLDIQEDMRIVMEVQDPRTSMFAQFQDGYDYMSWVSGRPPRQARVVVGLPADFIGEINGGRAVSLCFGDPTTLAALLPSVIFETIGPGVLLSVGDADIVIPHLGDPPANSRGVPTHEYGHFVMCDLMHATNTAKFYETWANVIVNIIAPDRGAADPDPNNDTLYGLEAFADFFTLQLVGGTNYFTLPGARWGGSISYCPIAPATCPARDPFCAPECGGAPGCGQDCAEDNVGSPPGATSDYAISATPSDHELFVRNIARIVTIFHDAFDGVHGFPPAGRLNPNPAAAFPRDGSIFGSPVRAFTDASDEPIALPGSGLVDFFGHLYDQWATISEPNFLNALALTMFGHGYDANEVCDFFAIHALTGDCTDLLHPSVLSREDLVPGPVLGFRVERDPPSPDVTFFWRANSRFATGYELVLTPQTGTARSIPFGYADEVRHMERDLTGDMLYTASVVTINGPNRSEPVEQDFVTFADPVEAVSVTAGRGRIEVSWIPPASGRLQGYELWQLEPEERLLEVTTETSFEVAGLSDTFEYRFGVGTVNQVGEVGTFVQSARVRPLPSVVVYVAPSGDDDAPGAGSETTPFAHLGPALERAALTDADTIRMLEGVYDETGPLSISASIRIEGGYRDTGSAWAQDGDPTRIEVTGTQDGLLAPRTEVFNVSNKPSSAVVAVAGGLDVTLADVEISAVGSGSLLASGRCTAVIQVAGSNLTLERTKVRMERSASTGACVGGVFAVVGIGLDPRLSIYDSQIPGFGQDGIVAIPQGLELAGVAVSGGETLVVQRSRIAGLTAPALTFEPGDLSAAGLAVRATDYVRLRRSDFLAVDTPRDLRVFGDGALAGAEIEANVGVEADDSVFRTPSGGARNNALEVKSTAGGIGTADFTHITAVAGSDWDLSEAPTLPFEGAAFRIAGSIDVLHIVNSVFSFAAGGSNTPSFRWTGIDISSRIGLPTELAFEGNIVSTPGFGLYPNAEGALVFCVSGGLNEFEGAFDESGLQSEVAFTCGGQVPDTTRWHIGANIALTEAPNPARTDLAQPLPWCTAVGINAYPDGYLTKALPALPPPPLVSSGIALGDRPYHVQAPSDRSGRLRNRENREPAGAWLPLIEIDLPEPLPIELSN
jgi:hypothetical protein